MNSQLIILFIILAALAAIIFYFNYSTKKNIETEDVSIGDKILYKDEVDGVLKFGEITNIINETIIVNTSNTIIKINIKSVKRKLYH